MLIRPLDCGRQFYNWHFNSRLELENRGSWMKLHIKKGNQHFLMPCK